MFFDDYCNEFTRCHWNEQIVKTKTKRNEIQILFVWCFECWFDNLMWNCCCLWFFFIKRFFNALRKWILWKSFDEWIDWFEKTLKSSIDELSKISKTKKLTIDLLIKFLFLITMNWLIFKTKKSTIDCYYRWFTIIFANSRCVKWKWNSIIVFEENFFFIFANSR